MVMSSGGIGASISIDISSSMRSISSLEWSSCASWTTSDNAAGLGEDA
jgi:hypothetical protein